MGDIDGDGEMSSPAAMPRVRVMSLVSYMGRIALWFELGYGSDVRAMARLRVRFTVRWG